MSTGSRKTVTVIFVDLDDSTRLGAALDPEPLGALMLRYFEAVADVLRGHGGAVEKVIRDAGVGGVRLPAAHEDRAVGPAPAAVRGRGPPPPPGRAGARGGGPGLATHLAG